MENGKERERIGLTDGHSGGDEDLLPAVPLQHRELVRLRGRLLQNDGVGSWEDHDGIRCGRKEQSARRGRERKEKKDEPPMTRSGGSSGFSSTSRSYTSRACEVRDQLQQQRKKGKQRPLTFAEPVATAY
jgi:hypothetical protein